MLKTIIDVIEVDSDSNIEVRLKLLNEIGTKPIVISNISNNTDSKNNKNITALNSNFGT